MYSGYQIGRLETYSDWKQSCFMTSWQYYYTLKVENTLMRGIYGHVQQLEWLMKIPNSCYLMVKYLEGQDSCSYLRLDDV